MSLTPATGVNGRLREVAPEKYFLRFLEKCRNLRYLFYADERAINLRKKRSAADSAAGLTGDGLTRLVDYLRPKVQEQSFDRDFDVTTGTRSPFVTFANSVMLELALSVCYFVVLPILCR